MILRRGFITILLLIFCGLSLTGCRFPTELFFAPEIPPPSQLDTPSPSATVAITQTPFFDPTQTNTPPPCAFAQAEQSLPEVTAKVQDRLNELGLGSIEALAVAFGENCVDTINNKVISFSPIETDFFFNTAVEDTGDQEVLGNLAIRLLGIVEQFPPGETPGPNLGYLTIVFQDSKQDTRLRSRIADALKARDNGLTGEQFYLALGGT